MGLDEIGGDLLVRAWLEQEDFEGESGSGFLYRVGAYWVWCGDGTLCHECHSAKTKSVLMTLKKAGGRAATASELCRSGGCVTQTSSLDIPEIVEILSKCREPRKVSVYF